MTTNDESTGSYEFESQKVFSRKKYEKKIMAKKIQKDKMAKLILKQDLEQAEQKGKGFKSDKIFYYTSLIRKRYRNLNPLKEFQKNDNLKSTH